MSPPSGRIILLDVLQLESKAKGTFDNSLRAKPENCYMYQSNQNMVPIISLRKTFFKNERTRRDGIPEK